MVRETSYVLVLVALYFLNAFDYDCVCFFNFGPSSVKDVYFEEQMWISYKLNTSDAEYLGPIYASFFPLAFTFVPSSSILVMSLFGRDIGARGNVVGILLTLYPVLEPLVILSYVTSYREAIKMYLGVLKYTSNRRCSVSAIKF
ncbi:unnamed protein product [Nippostrongylus brasiliensis]|uniref:EXPERA domain-containing protein n=1 Tax=Nippostrongylus brasiliensis TaxID=27835 RepID=A0A0N4Y7J7_NIPBR|nr:unnamed protein product [Nippostrongylus brasiliensis]